MLVKVIITSFVATLAMSQASNAQIGGTVSGTLDGSVNGTIKGTTSTRTRIGSDVSTRVRVKSPARVSVKARNYERSSYHGGHYHGSYFHNHGSYNYDHFHDHHDAHTRGYAQVVVKLDSKSNSQPVGPLLTYGTQVFSRKDRDLGQIIGLTRSETGVITHVVVSDVPKSIAVKTLRAEGDVLITSKKRKHLK